MYYRTGSAAGLSNAARPSPEADRSPIRTGPPSMPGATLSPSIGRAVLKRSGGVVDMLSLLSNPFRIAILHMLALEGEMQPQELSRRLGVSQSATSLYLANLFVADIVQCRRVARLRACRGDSVCLISDSPSSPSVSRGCATRNRSLAQ